ncbi:MAG TPA: hypothetical protein VEM35_04880 [Rhizomicrobium sp.]|nr:hypothetical protein [Rhizomicrobium sp.]
MLIFRYLPRRHRPRHLITKRDIVFVIQRDMPVAEVRLCTVAIQPIGDRWPAAFAAFVSGHEKENARLTRHAAKI